MNLYRMHEAEFILPDATQDQSVHVFGFHSPDPFAPSQDDTKTPEFSVVISRDTIDSSVTLSAYLEQQFPVLEKNLTQFHLIAREQTLIGGQDAVIVEYTWNGENGRVHQMQAYLTCPSASALRPNTHVALTITGTTQEGRQERYRVLFDNLIQSLNFYR